MSRSVALLLLVANVAFMVAVTLGLSWFRQTPPLIPTTELQQDVTAALDPATAASDVQKRREALIKIVVGSNKALHAAAFLVNTISGFAIFVAGMNVVFISIGIWQASKRR